MLLEEGEYCVLSVCRQGIYDIVMSSYALGTFCVDMHLSAAFVSLI